MPRTMSSESKRLLKTLSIAILLLSLAVAGDARKTHGSSRRTGSSSSSRSRTTYTRPSHSSNSHADQAKLSYPSYNQQPNRPQPQPSAPVAHPAHAQPTQNIGWNTNTQQGNTAGGSNRPIGWNVDQPAQKQNIAPANSANPPPYSAVQNHGPPPPYSAQAQPNPATGYHAPPPYSPQAGAPNQPHYAGAPPPYQQHPGGFPQQGAPPDQMSTFEP
uniref:Uncharacterized protein n=1 Tax=Phlebotomus papatasi TaxID=29031 RepID=A0A1B0D0A0_PHLPP